MGAQPGPGGAGHCAGNRKCPVFQSAAARQGRAPRAADERAADSARCDGRRRRFRDGLFHLAAGAAGWATRKGLRGRRAAVDARPDESGGGGTQAFERGICAGDREQPAAARTIGRPRVHRVRVPRIRRSRRDDGGHPPRAQARRAGRHPRVCKREQYCARRRRFTR